MIYYSGNRDVGWDSRQVCTQEHIVSQVWGHVGCGLPTEMMPTDQAPVFSSQQDFPGEKLESSSARPPPPRFPDCLRPTPSSQQQISLCAAFSYLWSHQPTCPRGHCRLLPGDLGCATCLVPVLPVLRFCPLLPWGPGDHSLPLFLIPGPLGVFFLFVGEVGFLREPF